jgi:hypothetical protein
MVNRPYPKLAFKYFGPYKVMERIGAVAYRLELPDTTQVHLVFHVSQLKPFVPDHTPVYDSAPMTSNLDATAVIPLQVIDRRLVKKGNATVPQVRVIWQGLPATSTTWEDYHVLKQRFPAAPAWGQAASSAGGGVTAATTS